MRQPLHFDMPIETEVDDEGRIVMPVHSAVLPTAGTVVTVGRPGEVVRALVDDVRRVSDSAAVVHLRALSSLPAEVQAAWVEPGEEVRAIGPRSGGRWLVQTRGTDHIWDLNRRVYSRQPGEGRANFDFDGQEVSIGRVGVFPAVDGRSVVFFDDPIHPGIVQWRVSSTIRVIRRLPDDP